MTELVIRNRQRLQTINLPVLRQITAAILSSIIRDTPYEIGIYLVSADEITRINETYLNHQGSTDVISFHYPDDAVLRGELFISTSDAVQHAKTFKTQWESEVVRYVAHGLLHLIGFDDLSPHDRREMKREENRIVRTLAGQFDLRELSKTAGPARPRSRRRGLRSGP